MEHALAWFVAEAPGLIWYALSALGMAMGRRLWVLGRDHITNRWLRRVEGMLALDDRKKEAQDAAEAFTADTRVMLEEANRRLAEDLRAANADIVRLARLANAYEQLARERGADLDAAMSGFTPVERPPRSEPPDVVELDDRPTSPPLPPSLPPLLRSLPPRNKP